MKQKAMRRWAAIFAVLCLLASRAFATLTLTTEPQSCTSTLVSWSDPGAHPGQTYVLQRSQDGGLTFQTLIAQTAVGQASYLDTTTVCCLTGQTFTAGCCTTQYTYQIAPDGILLACGDVNGDGFVNIADALVIAQFDVGLRQCNVAPFGFPDRCDVNNDIACNVGDALFIAQCDAGLRSCAFNACTQWVCGGSI